MFRNKRTSKGDLVWSNLLYHSEIIFKNNPDIPVGTPNYIYNGKKILFFGQVVTNRYALVNQESISRVSLKLLTLVKTYGSPGKIKDVLGGANGIIVGFCVLYVDLIFILLLWLGQGALVLQNTYWLQVG